MLVIGRGIGAAVTPETSALSSWKEVIQALLSAACDFDSLGEEEREVSETRPQENEDLVQVAQEFFQSLLDNNDHDMYVKNPYMQYPWLGVNDRRLWKRAISVSSPPDGKRSPGID